MGSRWRSVLLVFRRNAHRAVLHFLDWRMEQRVKMWGMWWAAIRGQWKMTWSHV